MLLPRPFCFPPLFPSPSPPPRGVCAVLLLTSYFMLRVFHPYHWAQHFGATIRNRRPLFLSLPFSSIGDSSILVPNASRAGSTVYAKGVLDLFVVLPNPELNGTDQQGGSHHASFLLPPFVFFPFFLFSLSSDSFHELQAESETAFDVSSRIT